MKKCPISRANIIHFETFVLYQNVSYKMHLENALNALKIRKRTPLMPNK